MCFDRNSSCRSWIPGFLFNLPSSPRLRVSAVKNASRLRRQRVAALDQLGGDADRDFARLVGP